MKKMREFEPSIEHLKKVHQSNLPKEVLKLPKINTHRSILKASNNPNEVYENININRSSPSAKNRNLGYNGCCSSETPRKVKKVGFVDDTISEQTSNSKIISTKREKELQNQEHKEGKTSKKSSSVFAKHKGNQDCVQLEPQQSRKSDKPISKNSNSGHKSDLEKTSGSRSGYGGCDRYIDNKYRSPETIEFMKSLEKVFEGYSDEEKSLQSKFPDYPGSLDQNPYSYNERFGTDDKFHHQATSQEEITEALVKTSKVHHQALSQDEITEALVKTTNSSNNWNKEVAEVCGDTTDVNVSHNPWGSETTGSEGVSDDHDTEVDEKLSRQTSHLHHSPAARHTSHTSLHDVIEEDDDVTVADHHDLTNFRFDLLTKPNKEDYVTNQLEYKRYCRFENIIPNAFILRSLVTNAMILQSQQLGPRGIKALCCALATNHWCIDLEISQDDISIKTMMNVSDMLIENGFLTSIDLGDNKMGRGPVRMLIEALRSIDRITALNLSGNCLTDADGDIFADFLTETTILKDLDLSYNGFRCEAGSLLGKSIGRNGSLEFVSLRWNHLNFSGGQGLIKGLEGNSSIKFLDLAWNGLGSEGVRGLTRMLKKNSTLEELDISANRINMSSMLTLLGAIKKNASLRDLHMGENVLSSRDIHELLETLLTTKGELSVKNLNLGRCTVNLPTVGLVERMIDERDIMVIHGAVYGEKEKTDSELLATLNPVTVLLEFGRLLEMTLEELFNYIDEDGGGTLDRDEIRNGMNAFDIPLPERSLDILIRKMDSDGDGEIALSDLQKADNGEECNRIRDKMKSKSLSVSNPETEKIRCRKILGRLLAENEKKREAEAAEAAAEAALEVLKELKADDKLSDDSVTSRESDRRSTYAHYKRHARPSLVDESNNSSRRRMIS